MPMYTSQCAVCARQQTYFKSVAKRAETPMCHDLPTLKVIDTPMIGAMSFSGHKGFEAPGAQKWIEDGASMKKYMNQHGYISESEGAREAQIQRNRKSAADDAKLDAAVTSAVISKTDPAFA